jgi:hypothetical protein
MAKNDEKIKQLMGLVDEKKAKLGKKPATTLKTNGVFKMFGDGRHTNINTINDMSLAVGIVKHLIMERKYIEEAEKLLGVDSGETTWDGYDVDEWIFDIKTRVSIIQYNEEKRKLAKLEKSLQNLISEDAKTEMELDNIADLLK